MSEFCPGQRVLCIDGSFHPSVWEYVNEVPIEGEIYTVDWIRPNGRENVTGRIGPALALKEVPGTLPGVECVVCWCAWRFAPVDTPTATSVAKRKKCVSKKTRAPRPHRRKAEPALV